MKISVAALPVALPVFGVGFSSLIATKCFEFSDLFWHIH
jgi:hypothetical protein